MNLHSISDEKAVSLVDRRSDRWPHCIFATISPNPKVKHSVTKMINGRKTTLQMPYGKLPQRVQHDYLLRVIRSSYVYSEDTKIFGTWELNKDGNVHFHLIMTDPHLKNVTDLKMFQRDVLNSELVMKNLSKGMVDYMNNIVFVNDSPEARFKYITKDMKYNLPIMPYFYKNLPIQENITDVIV